VPVLSSQMLASLPHPIQSEIFTLSSSVGDAVIDYLCCILENIGYTAVSVDNYDTSVIIYLSACNIEAELRVDRILQQFEVVARHGDYTVLPCNGNWNDVLVYLDVLRNGMNNN